VYVGKEAYPCVYGGTPVFCRGWRARGRGFRCDATKCSIAPQGLTGGAQALGLCGDLGDREGELQCLQLLASVHLAHRDPRAALAALDRAADLAALRGDAEARAACHDAMARARAALGDAWLASVHVQEAAAIRDAAGLRPPASPASSADTSAAHTPAHTTAGPPAPPVTPVLPAALASLAARGGASNGSVPRSLRRGDAGGAGRSPSEVSEGSGPEDVLRAGAEGDVGAAGAAQRAQRLWACGACSAGLGAEGARAAWPCTCSLGEHLCCLGRYSSPGHTCCCAALDVLAMPQLCARGLRVPRT
jgi:hypothetical protein